MPVRSILSITKILILRCTINHRGSICIYYLLSKYLIVTGTPYREVNSKVITVPKLKVEDKDKVNNSPRIKVVKPNIGKLKALLNKFS